MRVLTVTVVLISLALLVSCLPAQAPPSAELAIGHTVSPDHAVALDYMAQEDECSEVPIVLDQRDESDPSLGTLPRMEPDDWDVLQNFYKLKQDETYGCERAQPGELYWDAYAIEFGCGPALFKPQWFYEDGARVTDVSIAAFNHWPGAPSLHADWDPRPYENAEVGWSDNGIIGWAYSGDAHIGDDGGVFAIWTSSDPTSWSDRRVGSTVVYDLGFWDNHCTPSPLFKERRKAGTPPVGDGAQLLDIDEEGNVQGQLQFQTEQPQGKRSLGLSLDGVLSGWLEWGQVQ
jgi:hypothetical protein